MSIFPKWKWKKLAPESAGFQKAKLKKAKQWLDDRLKDGQYRFLIVRGGKLVVEWYHNISKGKKIGIASANKSITSNVIGVVLKEGKLPTADAKVVDYYPEMMDVPEGEGPKPGRYAFAKDREITFRQLISNTSGYMKPGEEPGQVFHYQTYGMNVLQHSMAKLYGLYDINNPQNSPGFKVLFEEKIAKAIGAHWDYRMGNFKLHEKARLNIFGNSWGILTTAHDFARLGWLWRNHGRWGDTQVVPEDWMKEAVKTAPDIKANCSEEHWKYGYGFWTNDHGKLWPDLPRDGYTCSGAGGHYICVFPSLDLMVVQNPGAYCKEDPFTTMANPDLLKIVLDACG